MFSRHFENIEATNYIIIGPDGVFLTRRSCRRCGCGGTPAPGLNASRSRASRRPRAARRRTTGAAGPRAGRVSRRLCGLRRLELRLAKKKKKVHIDRDHHNLAGI